MNKISNLISEYPFYTGVISLLIGIITLVYKIRKKESFNMNNYNVAGWNVLISSWALILLAFIFGMTLIFK